MIGSLFMVGKMVTPPPPGPPEPPKAQPAGAEVGKPDAGASRQQEMKMRMEEMKKRMGPAGKPNKTAPVFKKPAFDPESIDVTSDYFLKNEMGAKGAAEMKKKVEEARAERAKQRAAATAAAQSVTPPPGAPTPAPQASPNPNAPSSTAQ